MKDAAPQLIKLEDYRQPSYWIEQVELLFELNEDQTRVLSRLSLVRNTGASAADSLILNGEQLVLGELRLDGELLDPSLYEVTDTELRLVKLPERGELSIETFIKPQENTSLEGLYKSSGNYCTQCEAEGFRKITYFLDRPDVMAKFTTTIIADKKKYPVLLSNGNPAGTGDDKDGRHWAKWDDPFKKPCYLFALVAGDLGFIEDTFTTMSGREVLLRIYVQHHNIDQCDHAMASLIKSMRWDEDTYGREYDLDVYNIVAVDDFNMGAMENKGLNVFNSKFVLAKQDTATDMDFINIEAVIAHEYFHNWSGNRVTCRDWFQLTLKEGLTVLRDQQFTADMNAATPKRIDDVNILRTAQFAEDGGPMAHPIQPDSYIEINNFYTVTVYNKGAEVIRMIHTLLGVDGFRKGMDLYFSRHDGQAVTTEEFIAAMEAANGIDLKQFRRWYKQAGTPVVKVAEQYDEASAVYTLELSQSTAATPGQEKKQPFHIPVMLGLIDRDGADMDVTFNAGVKSNNHYLAELKQASQQFMFENVKQKPVLSLLREFSAPVKLEFERPDDELAFCMAHDSDEFNRWEAGQQLGLRIIQRMITAQASGEKLPLSVDYVQACGKTLNDDSIDKALKARALALPSPAYVAESMAVIDVDGIHLARESIQQQLAQSLQPDWLAVYEANQSNEFDLSPASMGRRFLKNLALAYLMYAPDVDGADIAMQQYRQASNMTDQLSAFRALVHHDTAASEEVIDDFYRQWQHDQLVLDKWFTIQASAPGPHALERVTALFDHAEFDLKNPNRVRSLLGAFCAMNPTAFHRSDGKGYRLLAEYVEKLDTMNPQIAARLTIPLTRWQRYDASRQQAMCAELDHLRAIKGLSSDVYELVSKSLDEPPKPS